MQRHPNPGLRAIISEASVALAHLDAERLEEMAIYCKALIDEPETTLEVSRLPEPAVSETHLGVATFRRVLVATNANLQVMRNLRGKRDEKLEYGPLPDGCNRSAWSAHGQH